MMLSKTYLGRMPAVLLIACIWMLSGKAARSQEGGEVPPPPPPPGAAPEQGAQSQGQDAATASPAAPQQSPTVIYALPPGSVIQQPQQTEAETDPLVDLRKKPRRLRVVDGEAPPPGYVEVEQRRKGMIIAGSAVFGGVWLACAILSSLDSKLAIPVVGPVISAWGYEDSSDSDVSSDTVSFVRMWGVIGTLAQTTGVALFIIGMSVKKTVWLRQDIAGATIFISPTLVGENEPGLGIVGTF